MMTFLREFFAGLFESEEEREFGRIVSDTLARGGGYEEISREMDLRTALAEIRRVASDRIEAYPEDALMAVDIAAEAACKWLDPRDVKVLRKTISRLGFDDLLYPDAARIAKQARRRWLEEARIEASMTCFKTKHDEDWRAALRVRRR
jgi:hypothetical protein